MASIQELKERITDLHDVADRLGLERPQAGGNYKSPFHSDKSPSLSIKDNYFNDFSNPDGKGDVIALVAYVNNCSTGDAVKWLHDQYGIPYGDGTQNKPQRPTTLPQIVANNCIDDTTNWKEEATRYLVEGRGLCEDIVKAAIDKKAVGWNTYTNPKRQPGELGYGGPGVAFIVRDMSLPPGIANVVGVDLRYEDPELNGGKGGKTKTLGDKQPYPWFSDINKIKKAKVIYLVESPINALSVECTKIPGAAAMAVRGAGTMASEVDLTLCKGKKVVIAMDHDKPNERTGYCPGQQAAWVLNERLTAMNIASRLVDFGEWELGEDINDVLKDNDAHELNRRLQILEPWAIPGLIGDYEKAIGKSRLFLPSHDSSKYWTYRVKDDFTTYISKIEEQDTDEGKVKMPQFADLAGFRVAGLSRVTVASTTATMTGEQDAEPRTLFAVAIQAPRHGAALQRRVFDDDTLHNIDQWRKFGPVFAPAQFSRLLSIWERAAHLGARTAINFVGIAWREGKLVVNEGPDCYFEDPKQQCTYHNLTFPSGTKAQAKQVLDAYMNTFAENPASQLLIWALGAHLKTTLGFWPHMQLQADKGAGKSTIIKRLERTIAFKMLSSQAIKTEFRIITSISATSHPIGWEEFSTLPQALIDKALGILQQCYQFNESKRNTDMKVFIESAPVLLAGEDVPVQTLTGKICRATLKAGNQGAIIDDELPRFPVKEWLDFIVTHSRKDIKDRYKRNLEFMQKSCSATGKDAGARRMVENYTAVLTAWELMVEWLDLDSRYGNFIKDLVKEMNEHIMETSSDREPWVWIMDVFLSEIRSGKFRAPYKIDYNDEGRLGITFMPKDVMHHIKTDSGLRGTWDGLPVKSDRVFKKQIKQAEVVSNDDASFTHPHGRQTHAITVDQEKLAEYGLHIPEPETHQAAASL